MDLIAHIDGGARGNPGPAAIGVVVKDSDGKLLFEEGRCIGHGTNNEAEYRALIRLLEVVGQNPALRESGAKTLRVHCDSKLIVMQVIGEWKIKEPRLRELYDQVQLVKRHVPFVLRIKHVPREENRDADRMVNMALDKA
ncbi:MAG TPA: ribonuclease HI family protein [bacterium]